MNSNFNILITSVSKKIPFIKAVKKTIQKLGNNGLIYGSDIDDECIGKNFTDYFWNMPRLSDIKYVDIIDYCNKHNIKAIIPTRDGELDFFSQNNKFFHEAGINVMISPLKTVSMCIDKLLFYQELNKLSLPAIETFEDINKINSENIVVKERFGAGAKKIGLNLSKEKALEHAKKLDSPIFQPYITGEEISVDFYVDKNGKLKGVVPRVRYLVVNGESQITHTISDDKIDDLCQKITDKIEFYGHIILQLIKDEAGGYHIIECNCRFGGASTLGIAAGLDSFYWFLLESAGIDIKSYQFIKNNRQIKQIRYPEDLIVYGNSF